MVEISRPATGNYILLQSLSKDKSSSRAIHVLMPDHDKSSFKLGRGHESDIRITDISVSRYHALLRCAPEGYFLEDNNSKFGSLVLQKSAIEIIEGISFAIQVGRSVISCSIRPFLPDTR